MIGILFIILSGFSEGVMDKIQFHFHKSVFKSLPNQFWNPKLSWRNKWKNGEKKYGEKFLLSSTLLVWLTDAWHLFKSLRTLFLFLGLFFIAKYPLTYIALDFVMARVLFGLSFSFTYYISENDSERN